MKQHAPATQRNREPIAAILQNLLPPSGTVLEIASGSGQHAVFFARHFPHITWQPTDIDDASLASIRAWAAEVHLGNLLPPVRLDASSDIWPVEHADVVVSINMVHISPWRACQGLLAGAGRVLPPGGVLYLYGPYRVEGRPTAPSNDAFDASLRQRNPEWGLRYVHEVAAEAHARGLELEAMHDMPANNLSLIFRRS